MLQNDSILICIPSVHRTRIQCITRRTCRVLADPNVEILVSRPLNEFFHLGIADIGQFTDNSIDSWVTIPIGISLRQTKFDFNVSDQVFEFGNDIINVGIQSTKVGIQDIHGIMNLSRGDVFWAIEMNDVKDDWNDQYVVSLRCRHALLRFNLQSARRLNRRTPRFWST